MVSFPPYEDEDNSQDHSEALDMKEEDSLCVWDNI
jgi:hypothetical protein